MSKIGLKGTRELMDVALFGTYTDEITIVDVFELINRFRISMIDVTKNGENVVRMDINKFNHFKDTLEFSQENTSSTYTVKTENVESVKVKMQDNSDTLQIDCKLVDGTVINIFIFFTNEGKNGIEKENCYESDVYELKEYIDSLKEKDSCPIFSITDEFGLKIILDCIDSMVVEETDDGFTFYANRNGTKIELPLVDDSCNGVYYATTESESSKEIGRHWLIKPYGQPFMEIRFFIMKNN